ncbi:hypothetical protein [Psychroserpens sp. NJDZ02]|uniref:hypothetical protein n=1 Tax=Psychroserpens sp. NJDZ02 TaxID=2570561 RepID=UPI0010A924BC|nr:hypothetical protein [Psychroserpens sp. NJDZ02]QCE42406.1 hypothetical protein E9099_13655 [Psychroserpens sp. NJDZ02]
MIVFDRILNKEIHVSKIKTPIVLGRYIFTSDNAANQLNGCEIKKQDFLVPYKSLEGELNIESNKRKILFQENTLLNDTISSLIKHSLLDVSEEIKYKDDLLLLSEINILLRNFDERLEISEFELFIQTKLFHIEEVCRQPSYHLKREITKLNVSRAKRIPVKAINYLAAHTEDWSRRKIRSVEPRKVLTEIIDYDLEIYENQVTVRFIDKLLVYFSQRMVNEIDVIDSFIENIEQIIKSRSNSGKKKYWYKKLDNDYKKLGKAVASIDASRIKVEKIKVFISSIQMRLFGLLKSDLYINNSRQSISISQKLKRTNLFDNHQHYRFVKVLWDKFHTHDVVDYSRKSKENQDLVKSFADYSWVLFLRALYQLGFINLQTKNNSSIILKNNTIPNVIIRLVKNEKQTINVFFNENRTLSFVPVPSTTDNFNIYPKESENTFYLTLVGSEERNDIIKISPTAINSEENIAKILFKHVLELYTNAYLFKLDSQSISKFSVLNTWLKKSTSLVIDNGVGNKIDLWLKRKLNNHELKELDTVLIKQNQELNSRTDIRARQINSLKEIEKQLKILGKTHFEQYEACVRCCVKNPANITTNAKKGFKYKCSARGCEVEYGFTEKGVFYKVRDYEKIMANLEMTNSGDLLNAFGFEYI